MLRKLVRAPIKLPVAQPPPLKHHRSRIRPPARLRRKQRGQAPRQNLPPGRVPPRQDALALLSPKQFQPPDRTIRMRNRTRQQPQESLQMLSNSGFHIDSGISIEIDSDRGVYRSFISNDRQPGDRP